MYICRFLLAHGRFGREGGRGVLVNRGGGIQNPVVVIECSGVSTAIPLR